MCASLALVATVWLKSLDAHAQVLYGSVVGTVIDSTGELFMEPALQSPTGIPP